MSVTNIKKLLAKTLLAEEKSWLNNNAEKQHAFNDVFNILVRELLVLDPAAVITQMVHVKTNKTGHAIISKKADAMLKGLVFYDSDIDYYFVSDAALKPFIRLMDNSGFRETSVTRVPQDYPSDLCSWDGARSYLVQQGDLNAAVKVSQVA